MSIEGHKFQDQDVLDATCQNDGTVTVDIIDFDGDYIIFDRDDIIAMAKAIELTGEDLK